MSMANKDKCFIITPIGDDTDPIRRHIEGIIDAALRPALEINMIWLLLTGLVNQVQ